MPRQTAPRLALAVLVPLLAAAPAAAQAPAPARPAPANPNPNPSFNLVNQGARPIAEFYASPAGVTRWGDDRLGGQALAPGARRPVQMRADGNCLFDLQAVYQGGTREERRGINTCTAADVAFGGAPAGQGAGQGARPGAPAAPAGNPSFNLRNGGAQPIREAYAMPDTREGWGRNRLPEAGVAPGQSFALRLPADGTCVLKVRVVFADGASRERRGVDTCATATLSFPE